MSVGLFDGFCIRIHKVHHHAWANKSEVGWLVGWLGNRSSYVFRSVLEVPPLSFEGQVRQASSK